MRSPQHDELPPPLAELREQFRQAAAREIEVERRVAARARRGRIKVVAAVALGLVVPAAGVAGATRILSSEGDPGTKDVPVADAGVVPSSAVADPGGGPPWAVKVFTNRQGQDCVVAGRLQGGKLGRFTGGEFVPLPERVSGNCGDLGVDPVILTTETRPEAPPRTLVYGLSRERGPITVEARGRRQVKRPQGLGTFMFVFEGVLAGQSATVSFEDGERLVQYRVP